MQEDKQDKVQQNLETIGQKPSGQNEETPVVAGVPSHATVSNGTTMQEAIVTTETQPILTVIDGNIKTTSLDVAEKFNKEHRRVLQAVRELGCPEDFAQHHFVLGSYQDTNNQPRPMYNISRDGFCLLAMSFTGKEAMSWKVSYITAFNRMETELLKLNRPTVDETERRRLRDQKSKLVKLVVQAKTKFEQDQHVADLTEVCMTLGQPLPNTAIIGVPVAKRGGAQQ